MLRILATHTPKQMMDQILPGSISQQVGVCLVLAGVVVQKDA